MRDISFRTDILPLKNSLYRLALRITQSKADAEDVVQETLIKVWNRRGQWHEIESIEAFTYAVCRNQALDHQKRTSRHSDTLGDMPLEREDTEGTPYDHAASRDRVRLVRSLVDALPEKQRSCMQLRDFEGKTYREVADILGITEEQVKVNIFRARQTIKQRFKQADDYGL